MPEFYLTKKKRKLTGKRLETFNQFWKIFGYPKGKAEAADSWLDIPTLTDTIVNDIMLGAKAEAMGRQRKIDSGRTPKMAQGWITARRWEDELGQKGINKPAKKASPVDNMVQALNILTSQGQGQYEKFCDGVKMDTNDREAVMNKYNMVYDVNKLGSGIGG